MAQISRNSGDLRLYPRIHGEGWPKSGFVLLECSSDQAENRTCHNMFELHPQLKQDCIPLGRFSLCQILLMNDNQYPWFLLVPERDAVSEIYQLSDSDQLQLWRESAQLSRRLASTFNADKMNIAALGNIVPQLHVHHIVRFRNDPAWPAPVWGKQPAQPYTEAELQSLLTRLLPEFNEQLHLA